MLPGANHTEAECRGLKARNQGSSSNEKTYVHKNKHKGQGKTSQFTKYQGQGKEKSFDSSKGRFHQDKGKAGNSFQCSSSSKKSYKPPSKASGIPAVH
jgi:hypothetical protein